MAVRQFRQSLYLSHIRGARAELAAGDPAGAGRVLDQTEFALRGWEYTHLRRRAEGTPLILRGESGVLSVAFSPDGARLVTARENGEVRVTDTRTGRELISLLVPGGLTSVALSPDGSRLLIGSRTQSARVWDFRTATEILALRGYAEEILSVAYSPDGSRFATGSKDKTARIWDAHTGAELLTLRGGPSTQRGDVAVLSVAFSPDGRRLAAALDGETVRVWDARTGRELLAPVNRDAVATALAFSPDGTRLALLSAADDLIRVRDSTAPTGEEVVFGGHGEPVVAAAFGPDGTRLATGDEDGKVRLWDPRSGAELFTLSVHTGAVRALSFSPDGDRLATGSRDGSVRLWDSRSAPEALALQSSNNSVLVAAFSHSDSVLAVAFSPDGRRLATGSRDNTARVWDARTGLELFTLAGHGNDVTAVAFSPDGTRVATSSDDKTMRLWDAVTGRLQFVLNGHGGRVTGVAFSPDGTRLATASWDLSFRVWDARSGDKLLDIGGVGAEHGHSAALTAVTYSPDGSRLATTAQDGSARVWDARTGTELLCLRHPEIVTAVAFSPDGSRLATGSEDNAARLWDGRTGEELFVLRGHGSAVASVSFSPDGSRLVTGSADNTARLWDVRTGAELLTLRGDGFRVNGVAFSPGGGQIAMACGKTVRIWDARSDRLAVPPSTPLAPFDAAKPWSAEDHARTVNLISWLVPALRTPGPYNPWVEGEDRRQAWAVTRHAVDAAVAVRRNDPFAAAFHLARVNELPVRWPADRVRRGLCRLWMGRRAEALADLAHPQLAGENDTSRLQWHALACLATGDRAGYRAACARRLTLFGPDPEPDWANDAAWCFCLGPGAAVDPGAVVRLAEKAVKADPRDWNAINTLGAALLRAGRPADAVGRLEESLRLGGGQEDTFNELFLVLAHHQLGHAAEARRWLQAAAAKMDGNRTPARVCGTLGAGPAGALAAAAALLADRPEPLAGKDDYILTKWLEMDVLRAEAEAALAGAGPRQ
jgi:WD40 repeat protein